MYIHNPAKAGFFCIQTWKGGENMAVLVEAAPTAQARPLEAQLAMMPMVADRYTRLALVAYDGEGAPDENGEGGDVNIAR